MMSKSENFFEQVYQVVEQIPYGKVTTYGAIAEFLGSKSASRMVGWAMNNAHALDKPVPAHRVVNRQGLLTGKMHFKGQSMQERLEAEGIVIIEDQIQRFKSVFWHPNTLLP
jgi:methylated-DNA-protein-cysteine methyltransferase-like protein